MTKVTDINQYKNGVTMGKQLEAAMNFESLALFKTIKVDKGYPKSFYDVMQYIFEYSYLLTTYDVSLIFNGIAQNENVPKDTRQLVERICQKADVHLVLKDDMEKFQSGVYGKRPSVNKNKNRHLYIATYHYFKGMMEKPSDITIYDVCALAFSLKTISQLTKGQTATILGAIASGVDQMPKALIKNKAAYDRSLMKRYMRMPNTI